MVLWECKAKLIISLVKLEFIVSRGGVLVGNLEAWLGAAGPLCILVLALP